MNGNLLECAPFGQFNPASLNCADARRKNNLTPVAEELFNTANVLWNFEAMARPKSVHQICLTCPIFAQAFPEVISDLTAQQPSTT